MLFRINKEYSTVKNGIYGKYDISILDFDCNAEWYIICEIPPPFQLPTRSTVLNEWVQSCRVIVDYASPCHSHLLAVVRVHKRGKMWIRWSSIMFQLPCMYTLRSVAKLSFSIYRSILVIGDGPSPVGTDPIPHLLHSLFTHSTDSSQSAQHPSHCPTV